MKTVAALLLVLFLTACATQSPVGPAPVEPSTDVVAPNPSPDLQAAPSNITTELLAILSTWDGGKHTLFTSYDISEKDSIITIRLNATDQVMSQTLLQLTAAQAAFLIYNYTKEFERIDVYFFNEGKQVAFLQMPKKPVSDFAQYELDGGKRVDNPYWKPLWKLSTAMFDPSLPQVYPIVSETTTVDAEEPPVEENVEAIIKAHCEDLWEDNFDMRSSCITRQREGYAELLQNPPEDMSETDFATIKNHCLDLWPDNFDMRASCEKRQVDGWKELQ
jgi:hypothetical protein